MQRSGLVRWLWMGLVWGLLPAGAWAQGPPAGLLVASLQDSASAQPLAFANAALLAATDSTVATAQSDAEGRLQLALPGPGRYVLVISFVGYGTYRRPLRLSGPADLGVLKLGRSVQQ